LCAQSNKVKCFQSKLKMKAMRARIPAIGALLAIVATQATGAIGQHKTPPVLEFAATGDAKAQEQFVLGIAELHSSAYDEAAEHFRAAEKIDPNFAMAYWGEAMTFNHPFWNQQDIAGARRTLSKLGPTRSARLAKAATPREKAYLNAIEILYGDGDRDARDIGFATAMKKLAFDYPNDYEAAAFYVLALLSTRRVADPAYPLKQDEAAAICKSILEKYPDHPGALHYLIHAWDDPEHAPIALEVARKYEKLTFPDSDFHAMHMPSHIYSQLGMWQDVVRCNQRAFDASDRWVKSHNLSIGKRDYHSLEYLNYAQMQMGQHAKARESLVVMLKSAEAASLPSLREEAAVMASRFAIETGEWEAIDSFPADAKIPELLLAQGLAALAERHTDLASSKASALEALSRSDLDAGRRIHASTDDLVQKLLLARTAAVENHSGEALRLGLEAVQLEKQLDIPAELNGIVKPAAEFYGEMLLQLNKPDDAEKLFSASLKQRPKRALSLLGLARSRSAVGDKVGASDVYGELARMWSDADSNLAAVQEARRNVSQHQ